MQPEKLSYRLMTWPLSAGLTNFFLQGPDIIIFSALWAICSLSKQPSSAVQFESNHRPSVNKWVWRYPNTTKTGERLSEAPSGPWFRADSTDFRLSRPKASHIYTPDMGISYILTWFF